jgi:two-component system, LuxR family, response regulator FixJ
MPVQLHQAATDNIIAVVDDDPAVRASLKFVLEVEGFGVRAYSNARAMLEDGKFGDYRCVIVDQNMPIMTGLELVAQLRDQLVLVPAILITTHPSRLLRLRAEKAGVPIVEKPLLGNALVDRIRSMTADG